MAHRPSYAHVDRIHGVYSHYNRGDVGERMSKPKLKLRLYITVCDRDVCHFDKCYVKTSS